MPDPDAPDTPPEAWARLAKLAEANDDSDDATLVAHPIDEQLISRGLADRGLVRIGRTYISAVGLAAHRAHVAASVPLAPAEPAPRPTIRATPAMVRAAMQIAMQLAGPQSIPCVCCGRRLGEPQHTSTCPIAAMQREFGDARYGDVIAVDVLSGQPPKPHTVTLTIGAGS